MKFFSLLPLAALALTSAITPRDSGATVFGTLSDTVNVLVETSTTDLTQIQYVVQTFKDSTQATVEAQIKATLQEDYEAVIAAFKSATSIIVKVTASAIAGIQAGVIVLVNEELEVLAELLSASVKVVALIEATVTLTITDLPPHVVAMLDAEIVAVKGVLKPFVDPVEAFVVVVEGFSAKASLQVSALVAAHQDFTKAVQHAAATLGLPSLP